MPNIKKYTQFEQIELYYRQDSSLSDKDQEVAARWELAFSLLQVHRSKKVAVSKLIALEKRAGRALSVAQAYRDMEKAEKLFVPLLSYSKEIMRHVLIESCNKELKEVSSRITRSKDNSEFIKLSLVKDKIENRLIQLTGLADDLVDMPDFSKLEPHKYVLELDPNVVDKLSALFNKGVVDITSLMQSNSEDAQIVEDGKEID